MNLLIVKLYQLYKRKGDPNPEIKITGYLAMLLYIATWCVALPVIEILSLKFFDDDLKLNRAVLILASLLILYVYYKQAFKVLFKNKRMKALEEKHKAIHIPASLLYLVVILAPIFLLILGATLTVFLTGGEILGTRITGLFE